MQKASAPASNRSVPPRSEIARRARCRGHEFCCLARQIGRATPGHRHQQQRPGDAASAVCERLRAEPIFFSWPRGRRKRHRPAVISAMAKAGFLHRKWPRGIPVSSTAGHDPHTFSAVVRHIASGNDDPHQNIALAAPENFQAGPKPYQQPGRVVLEIFLEQGVVSRQLWEPEAPGGCSPSNRQQRESGCGWNSSLRRSGHTAAFASPPAHQPVLRILRRGPSGPPPLPAQPGSAVMVGNHQPHLDALAGRGSDHQSLEPRVERHRPTLGK